MTRKQSVENALNELRHLEIPFDYIAIHDGARPFVSERLIISTLAAATVSGGAIAIFSLEMPDEQLAIRMLAIKSRVEIQKLRT